MDEPEKKKRGRKSPWDESLGNVHRTYQEFPTPIWELLKQRQTKNVLNKMALDEKVRDQVWEIGESSGELKR